MQRGRGEAEEARVTEKNCKVYKLLTISELNMVVESEIKRYYTANDFDNPFFVVVHAEGVEPGHQSKDLFTRILDEIERIKEKYDWVAMDEWPPSKIPEGLPKYRPILVCGFFDYYCVQKQRDSLSSKGYKAYISEQGTCP